LNADRMRRTAARRSARRERIRNLAVIKRWLVDTALALTTAETE